MDRKSVIILILSVAALMAWFPITNKIYPPKPAPTNLVTRALGSAATNLSAGTNLSAQPILREASPAPLLAATNAPALPAPPQEEKLVFLENADARYTFTSAGGGLKLVELKRFPHEVGCKKSVHGTNASESVTLNIQAPLAAFTVLDSAQPGAIGSFSLSETGGVVRAEAALPNGLRLIKEFQLSTNYLVKAAVRYENPSGQAIPLAEREVIIGTATPLSHGYESQYLGLEWYDGRGAEKITELWFANKTMGCGMLPSTPRSVYRAGASNIVWAAVHNQFFTMIAVPEAIGSEIIGRRISFPPPSREELAADPTAFASPFGYQTGLVLPASAIPPQSFVEHRYDLFAGPKEYKTLQRLPKDMDVAMGFGTFGFFAKPLLLSMNGIHALGISYGISIILITVIIKLLFWPLTTASTRSMKRMAALQPEMKAIQEKYKDDPRKMNMKVMEFMKENKVSPLGGCLPLLLQIPVFFGFYTMLQSAIELRGASFLWACDLSRSDTIFFLAGFPVNPMPILMAGTMLWQARLTPMSPGMDPMQQKIMKYMPLMFVVFLYNFSAGLTLYWTVQNLLSIAQMKLTRTDAAAPAAAKPAAKPAAPVLPPKKQK